MGTNGDCPKCGKPFPASRRRCWSCSPGGVRKPESNGAVEGAKPTGDPAVARFLRGVMISASDPVPEEVVIAPGGRTTVLNRGDRESLLRAAYEARQAARIAPDRDEEDEEPRRELPPIPASRSAPIIPAARENIPARRENIPPKARDIPGPAGAIVVSTVDLEMSGLVAIVDTLRRLDPEAQGRVLSYVNSRFSAGA